MRSKWAYIAIGVVVACFCALIVTLSIQLQGSREQSAALADRMIRLHAGAFVPVVESATTDGSSVLLGDPGPSRYHLYFVYNTTCQYCLASIPAWRDLVERIGDDPNITVTGISLDSIDATQAYTVEHDLPYPSTLVLDQRARSLYRFSSVPQTLVINESGRVAHSRPGLLRTGPATDSALEVLQFTERGGTPSS